MNLDVFTDVFGCIRMDGCIKVYRLYVGLYIYFFFLQM